MSSHMLARPHHPSPATSALYVPHSRSLAAFSLLECFISHCIDPWGERSELRIVGTDVFLDGIRLSLTPASKAAQMTPSALSAEVDWAWMWPWPPPSPPGVAIIELTVVPEQSRWALVSATKEEHHRLLAALRDAIDLSHGADSPFGEWSFGETLGKGTFGTVRAAVRRQTGEEVAVKVLSISALDRQGDARKAIERERSIMQKLMQALPARAPLVRLAEMCSYGDSLFFFLTPRCEGDLLQLLDKGAFREQAAAAATRATLLAIAALHRAGIVHLDVKPQNLLYRAFSPGGGGGGGSPSHTRFDVHGVSAELFLGDFGCARALERGGSGAAAAAAAAAVAGIGKAAAVRHVGGAGTGLPSARGGWRALPNDGGGTLYFTPPEVIEENVQATSADVWAAGCVAFSLLHRRPPFVYDGESDELARLRILRAVPLYEPRDGGNEGRPHEPLSPEAMGCLAQLLKRSWQERPSAEEALREPWLASSKMQQAASSATSSVSAFAPNAAFETALGK